MTQLEFTREVTQALLRVGTSQQQPRNLALGPVGPRVLEEVRFDNMEHYMVNAPRQSRCKVCQKNTTKACSKCEVNLHQHCFIQYHIKH